MLPAQSILSNNFIISNALSGKGTTNLLVNLDKDYNRLETNHKFNRTSERRLSSESVREIEDKLECEYMPFYFHDIRTNEILPFHAFLESIFSRAFRCKRRSFWRSHCRCSSAGCRGGSRSRSRLSRCRRATTAGAPRSRRRTCRRRSCRCTPFVICPGTLGA